MATYHEEHIELLKDFVREQMGVVHARIVDCLSSHGPLTLYELANAVRNTKFDVVVAARDEATSTLGLALSQDNVSGNDNNNMPLDDGVIKTATSLLIEHQVLSYTEDTKQYQLRLGCGLLRFFTPVFLRYALQMYGDAGAEILTLATEYAALPLHALVQMACDRRPLLHAAIEAAVDRMRNDLIIIPVDMSEQEMKILREPPQKKIRRESSGGCSSSFLGSGSPLAVFKLNVSLLLHRVRGEAIAAFIAGTHDDAAPRVVRTMMALDTTLPKIAGSSKDGFPSVVDTSTSLALSSVRESLGEMVREEALTAAINRLSSEGPSSGVMTSSMANNALLSRLADGSVRLHYHRIVDRMAMEACEQVIFARYGILGVRLMKTLLKHGPMEDRFLAEEVIATLTQVRETLCAMMKDGYVRQQEIPKVMSAERQPKMSIFLWVMPKPLLFETTAKHFVKSLRHARLRLRVEQTRSTDEGCGGGLEYGHDSNASSSPPPTEERAKRSAEHALRSLKAAAFSLMDRILVMHYY